MLDRILVYGEIDGKKVEMNLDSFFMRNRVVYLNEEINKDTAKKLVQQLQYLDLQDTISPIILFINSPGGAVSDGMYIYDMMQACKSEIVTVAAGTVASMATLLLAAGAKGKRYILSHSSIMIHQPLAKVGGQLTDLYRDAIRLQKIKEQQIALLAKECGREELEQVAADMERDYWMDAKQAVAYGIVDHIGYPEELN